MIPKELIQKIRHIEIRTGRLVNDILAGEYHSVFKGRGMEFDEVREYSAGDDIRTIDWNVTARAGKLYVKRYVEERELTVVLLVDASSSGRFGTSAQMKSETAAEISALLAFSAIKNNDRVGLIIFTDKIEKFVPPKKGKKHVLRIIREILYFEPEKRGTNIENALEYLNKVINRKSVVFLISDFQSKGYDTALRIANKRHDVVAINIRDPREIDLPPVGIIEFEDAETGETIIIDTYDGEVREIFKNLSSNEASEIKQSFRKYGIDCVDVLTDGQYVIPLVRFFKARSKRF